jgi:hypothetical protein
MTYKISISYNWYCVDDEEFIVKMYSINGLPFTFDDISDDEKIDEQILLDASSNRRYNEVDLFKYSSYLIEEEAHPMLFPVDVENPEDMPV